MEFFEVVKKRVSIREYSDEPIKKEELEKIVDAGRVAMKRIATLCLIIIAFFVVSFVHADIITFKSGSKIEGKIVFLEALTE